MEPVLFYGVPHGCSFGSIVALEWLNQPYRLCRIDMLDKPKGYSRFNPSQQTPALLLESGETLGESLAVLHHIAARDLDRKLGFAQGTPDFDRLNRALAFLHTELHAAFSPAWAAFKVADGAPEKDMLRTMGRNNAAHSLAHLDAVLADRDWLVGNHRTVADAYLVGIARWAEDLRLFELARDYPRLHAHLQKLEADEAVIFAHAIEDERPVKSSGRFQSHVTVEELLPRLAA
ncbi:glutathione S-transferase [Phreatobacter stygius]|uniref:Glutathione S-transferase n=2 Tax=Phreatobacter stygius TaxID=1940610 RepID=A0A4D7BP46_9HYPH|nr:glutathione S-transferase [Phreatobacter stygius]